MVAPAASRRRVMACLSASVMGGAGAGVSAEPPPETRTSTRSSAPADSASVADLARGRRLAALVGHRVPGLDQRARGGSAPVAVLDHDEAVGDAVAPGLLDRGGHGARGLARPPRRARVRARAARSPARARRDERAHVAGGEGGVEDGAGGLAEGQRRSFCSRRPASISMSSVLGKQKRILVRPSSLWSRRRTSPARSPRRSP